MKTNPNLENSRQALCAAPIKTVTLEELDALIETLKLYQDRLGKIVALRESIVRAERLISRNAGKLVEVAAGITAKEFAVSTRHVLSRQRDEKYVKPRHAAMWLIRAYCDVTLSEVGKAMGGLHHSSVLDGITRCEEMLETDKDFRQKLKNAELVWLDKLKDI